MTDLGTLGGYDAAVFGSGAINSREQVAGVAELSTTDPTNPPFQEFHAFLWAKGVLTNLGTLGGADSTAFGINDPGQVVGLAATNSGLFHAFLWQNGVMNDLGTLGGTFSLAIETNNRGQVVGLSNSPGDTNFHGFLWGKIFVVSALI